MKSFGNVATAVQRPETGNRVMTISDDVTKMEEKRNATPVPRQGISKHGKSSLPTNPGKAPLEITNAIRRRQETSDLDYWHTLPPAQPQSHSQPQISVQPQSSAHPQPKPLYRAVLRGSLHGDNATTVCTLSSIVDAANDKEYNMVIRKQNGHLTNGYHFNGNGNLIHNKNFSVVRAEEMGLTINGLSLTEMKTSKSQNINNSVTSPNTSPRGNGWKGYSSAGIVKQRRLSGQQNNTNSGNKPPQSNNTNEKFNIDADQNQNRAGKNNSKTTNLQSTPNSKPIQKSPRLCLTNRQNNNENLPDMKRISVSPRTETNGNRRDNNNNRSLDTPSPNTSNKTGFLLRQASLPLTSSETKPTMTLDSNSNNCINHSKAMYLNQNWETTIAKRKFSNEIDNHKKLTKQESLPNPSSSSCLQFADSIISALTVDLNKMYSICQTKVRYAEFIEKSQPHRLDDANGQMTSSLKDGPEFDDQNKHNLTPKELKSIGNINNNNNNSSLSKINSKEPNSYLTNCSSSSSSSSPLSSNMTTKPNVSSKTPAPIRLAPLTSKPNKYTTLREAISPDTISARQEILDKDSPRIKTTRPILKSSKTDIDTNLPSFRTAGDFSDNNNTNIMGSNRLVRFKVNHEVREFAPSEPVRYY